MLLVESSQKSRFYRLWVSDSQTERLIIAFATCSQVTSFDKTLKLNVSRNGGGRASGPKLRNVLQVRFWYAFPTFFEKKKKRRHFALLIKRKKTVVNFAFRHWRYRIAATWSIASGFRWSERRSSNSPSRCACTTTASTWTSSRWFDCCRGWRANEIYTVAVRNWIWDRC